jgi:hypothetical protein
MAFYLRSKEEHWLRDKLEEGRIVVLDDESEWEIHPDDRVITERWLRISSIKVEQTQAEHTQKEGYPYRLKNTTERESARANCLTQSGGRMNGAPEVA